MKPKPRWMKSVIEAAKSQTAPLPTSARVHRLETAIKPAKPVDA